MLIAVDILAPSVEFRMFPSPRPVARKGLESADCPTILSLVRLRRIY